MAEVPISAPPETPPVTPETPPVAPNFIDTIPEGFRDKPYMKDIDSTEKLYSAFDGLQKKIGERPGGVPQEGATDEEWKQFNKSFGVPDTAAEYKVSEVQLPEGVTKDEDMSKALVDAAHKAGLSAKQFNALEPKFNEIMVAAAQKQIAQQAENDTAFDSAANDLFKDKRDEILESSRKLIAEHIPEAFKDKLADLPNESLLVMAGVLDSIKTKYISEDGPTTPGAPGAGPQTMDERRAEVRKLMMTPAYKSKMHPDHAATTAKIKELYAPLHQK